MDVFLDSNVIIADPWFRSQRTRILLDYAEKTFSTIYLLTPVEMEVRAHFKRTCESLIAGIDNAIKKAERNGLIELPACDSAKAISSSVSEWSNHFGNILRENKIVRVPLDNSVLVEALRRATERIPPCSESGRGVRDAIIWLTLIATLKKEGAEYEYIFISENTKDFAEPDKTSLRAELKEELQKQDLKLFYYPSLDSFIRNHAGRIEHITVEWVASRIDFNELDRILKNKLQESRETLFTVSDPRYRGYYDPWYIDRIRSATTQITGPVYVWEFSNAHIEVSIGCGVYAEAEIECIRTTEPEGLDYYDDFYPPQRILSCHAKLGATIAAKIVGDSLEILDVEEIYRGGYW